MSCCFMGRATFNSVPRIWFAIFRKLFAYLIYRPVISISSGLSYLLARVITHFPLSRSKRRREQFSTFGLEQLAFCFFHLYHRRLAGKLDVPLLPRALLVHSFFSGRMRRETKRNGYGFSINPLLSVVSRFEMRSAESHTSTEAKLP